MQTGRSVGVCKLCGRLFIDLPPLHLAQALLFVNVSALSHPYASGIESPNSSIIELLAAMLITSRVEERVMARMSMAIWVPYNPLVNVYAPSLTN